MRTTARIIVTILLIVVTNTAFAQVGRTVTTMFTPVDISEVELRAASKNVEIRETRGSRIMVEMNVRLENVHNPRLLDFVIDGGRYQLRQKTEEAKMIIVPVIANNLLVVKGEEVKEEITYTISIPSTIRGVKTSDCTSQ